MMFEKKLYLVLLLIFFTHDLHALVFERRKLIKDDIFEYYIVPAVVERSGVGRLYGLGVVLNNISVPWIDDGKFNLIGGFGKGKGRNHFEDEDIDAYTLVIVDFPIFSNDFTFSPARVEGTNMSLPVYERGIDSDPDRKLIVMAKKAAQNIGEISYYFSDRQIELYYTFFNSEFDFYGLIDYEGNFADLSNVEDFGEGSKKWTERWGILIDDTDFRRDPRIGYFLKLDRWQWPSRFPEESSQYQYDFEISGYIPIIEMKMVMVLNQFFSTSKVIENGTVDKNKYICTEEQLLIYPHCQSILDEYYKRYLENSKKGRATSLGGLERLRGYQEQRFFDEHTNFRAIELRYYFDPVDIDFHIVLAQGVLAEFQLAGFYEQGTVSPDLGENYWKNFKDSYGIGLRFITGSTVGRIDVGFSDEGGATSIWWDYPF